MDDEVLITGDSLELTEFIGGIIPIGVPFDAPIEFKKRMWAAATSYAQGNKSVDYFLRTYGDIPEFERPSTERRALCSFFRSVLVEAKEAYAELVNGIDRTPRLGLFAAEIALARTITSIRMCSFMLLQGWIYEGAALMRVALEQIAWAYGIHHRDDGKIFLENPTKCVSRLKEIIPDAGRKYSLMSKYTHINPKLQRQYIDFSGTYAAVMHSQHERSAGMGVLFGRLVGDYHAVIEWVSFDYIKTPKIWRLSTAGERLRSDNWDYAKKVDQFELSLGASSRL